MPFVNIRILEGHPQERKHEIARRVTETISEVAQLPREAVWVVFEDVAADDWYVGQSRSASSSVRPGMSGVEVWARTVGEGAGAPGGVKIDSAGNLYCCGPGGIHVFAADATDLGVIKVPEVTANFCWGDDDLKTLFITASTSLYRTRVNTPGMPQMR